VSSLRLERTFEAPRERVFDAWVDPELLRRWWASQPDWTSPAAEVDLRVGGAYRLSMQGPEGPAHSVVGEYREVERPARLVYTWSWEGDPPEMAGSAGTLVTVEFHADGPRTRVVVTHEGFEGDGPRDLHAGGWNGCLDNLEGRVLR
jgi:glutathione S-transferase